MPKSEEAQNPRTLRVLILEDSALDAELMVEQLAIAGFRPEWMRVENETDFALQLDTGIDLVLADYALPQFGALSALRLAMARGNEIPFIVVSGFIGDDAAAQCLRDGATDYVLKDRLSRLGPAVTLAMRNRDLRKREHEAEEALRRSEEMLATAQRIAQLGSWEIHLVCARELGTNPVRWSQEAARIYHLAPMPANHVVTAAEFLQRMPWDEQHSAAAVTDVLRTRKPYDAVRTLRWPDGSEQIVHERAELVFENGGERPTRLVGTVQDLTERHRAENVLRESERRYRLLFDRTPMPIWVFDLETLRFLAVNAAAIEHYGYSREEFLGMSVLDIRPTDDHAAVLESIRTWKAGERKTEHWRHRLKSGQLIDVEITSHEIVFGDREGRLIIVNDITERKRLEQIRRESEERFSAIFRASPAAIGISTIHDGRLVEANDQYAAFFGYARAELVDRSMAELQLWSDAAEGDRVWAQLRAQKAVRSMECNFRRKSGETRVALLAMEILDVGSEPMALTMLTDVTEKKQLEGELFRALRVESLGRLASGIAHDMNNVLAPIMMSAPLLRMDLPREEAEKTLATIESSAKRGADLVRQLLIFGRGVEGARGPLAPGDLIGDVVKMVRQTFPRSVTITTRIPRSLWLVRGDATQLHQVLLNLCVNARDAMPDGGALSITAENVECDANYATMNPQAKPGRYVQFSVSDNGTGIPPEIADRIFEPFFTTKGVGKGTGLGLSTVLGIVKSHEGFVRLQSEAGKGTTFQVHVPATVEPSGKEADPARVEMPRGQGETILIVDDEENIRRILRETLTRYNYKVLTATDGAEASAVFARSSADIKLVVTDIDMPFLDGVSLIRVLRRINPAVKIIISSGMGGSKGTQERIQELNALGVKTVLTKPYTADRILTVVHQSLAAPVRGTGARSPIPAKA